MTTSINVAVDYRSGTYIARHIGNFKAGYGLRASATSGAQQAVEALAKKLVSGGFIPAEPTVRQVTRNIGATVSIAGCGTWVIEGMS